MKEYKPLLFFLLKFFGCWILLSLTYDFYLKNTQVIDAVYYQSDPYTKLVASQASAIYNFFIGDSHVVQAGNQPYMIFYINQKVASVVNEGCNAFSVIILMISFLVAFGKDFFKTLIYIALSFIAIHTLNTIRVGLLSHIYLYHREYKQVAHDILFPAIIYGGVIVICWIWVQFFVFKKKKNG